MAYVKFNDMIESIRGSVGSLVFKKNGGSFSVQNKGLVASKFNLRQNRSLQLLSFIASAWGELSQLDKDIYNIESKKFFFLDKNGVSRNLKPRNFFTKLNTTYYKAHNSFIDNSVISDVFAPLNVISFTSHPNFEFILSFFDNLKTETAIVSFSLVPNEYQKPVYNRRKVALFISNDVDKSFDVSSYVMSQFPFLKTNDFLRVYVSFMNTSGFVSNKQSLSVSVK